MTKHKTGMGGHQSARAITDTWLTPPEIIACLGPFDLDPCAAPPGRPWPTAHKMIALPENGLDVDWTGHYVWLNPPYGKPSVVTPWLVKMGEHARAGGSGIVLLFARTDTDGFYNHIWLQPVSMSLLFLYHRLHFYDMKGKRAAANCGAPCVLIAYGAQGLFKLNQAYHAGELIGGYVRR